MKVILSMIVGAILGLSTLLLPAVQQIIGKSIAPHMLIEVASPLGFDETLDKIVENAKEVGWKVPGKWGINFQKNLEYVTGEDIGPNRVIGMCEPFAAVKILKHDEYKVLTAMMPCTIAVYEKSDGKTYISIMNMRMLKLMYGGVMGEIADELAPQMDKMIDLSK